jgi:lysophospholipase
VKRRAALVLLVAGAWAPPALAIPEDNYGAVRGTIVQPWYETHRRMKTVVAPDGVHLSAVEFPAADNDVALVILGGRTESHVKYAEVIHDLQPWGYSLYSYDHRGQGLSQRLLDNGNKQYVRDFDDYVTDLKHYLDTEVRPHGHRKVFILAHSMGGLIATLFAERYPHEVDGYVLGTPMHRFYTKPFPEPVAAGLGWFGVLTFQGDEYGPSQGEPEPESFDTNRVSHSRARWQFNDDLSTRLPMLNMGGVTYQWVQQAFGAASQARREAKKFGAPVLIFQASDDTVVRNDGQDDVCTAARECEKVMLQGARHESMQEVDSIRDEVLGRAHAFFETQRNSDGWDDATGCSQAGGASAAWLMLGLWMLRRRQVAG